MKSINSLAFFTLIPMLSHANPSYIGDQMSHTRDYFEIVQQWLRYEEGTLGYKGTDTAIMTKRVYDGFDVYDNECSVEVYFSEYTGLTFVMHAWNYSKTKHRVISFDVSPESSGTYTYNVGQKNGYYSFYIGVIRDFQWTHPNRQLDDSISITDTSEEIRFSIANSKFLNHKYNPTIKKSYTFNQERISCKIYK